MPHHATPSSSLTTEDAASYFQSTHGDTPVRLGIITNPTAAQGRLIPNHLRLSRLLDDPVRVVQTRHNHEVRPAIEELLLHHGVNVLGINGGDGTLHSVINAVWSLLDALEEAGENACEPPPMILLNGGTMNMASRAMHTKGDAIRTIRSFLSVHERDSLDDLTLRHVNVLKVHAGKEEKHGLIFGSELVHNALQMHRYFGDGYLGLARLVGHASISAAFKTATWRRFAHLLDPPDSGCQVDNVVYAPFAAVVISTIDLMLARGWIQSLQLENEESGLHAKLVLETDKEKLIRLIPSLILNKYHAKVIDLPEVQRIQLRGGFTLDGELYPATEDPTQELVVSMSPRQLKVLYNIG